MTEATSPASAWARRVLSAPFFSSDPDFEPFGLSCLRGLTLGRVALVTAILVLSEARVLARLIVRGVVDPLGAVWAIVEGTAEQVMFVMPVIILVTVADNWSSERETPQRVATLIGAVLVGCAYYATIVNLDLDPRAIAKVGRLRVMLSDAAFVVTWGGFLTAALYFLKRERHMAAAAQQARVERLALDEQMDEARLQMLQAQIEPHFLFNSLANIQGLYREAPEHGRRLLKDLSQYLRAALPRMRDATSTLGRELALAEAYLRVLQVRMGERLKVELDVEADARNADIPPMIVPTLVENAIKHGIAPMRAGGTIHISATRLGNRLRVAVRDDGAGFRQSSGTGIGLANSRSRLASLYGEAASLRLVANPDGGVTATVELPYRVAVEATA